jgi:16S rRNA (cytidine1402-2'-O)-methyltransferase
MRQQNSFKDNEGVGSLYLIPTPIGNLEDMTFRAIRLLKESDLVAAEDTRQTMKLFRHFEIETSLISYHEHNKQTAGVSLINEMKQGKQVSLVSDAGMPAISDPGYDLVQLAIQEGISVIAIPGANAALTSLIASGLPTERFQFIGFLPRQKKQRQDILAELKVIQATLMFYEAPHRLKETLQSMYEVLGNRSVCVCRELTKKFEEYQRGTLEEAVQWCEEGTIKGEFCIIVEGVTEVEVVEQWWNSLTLMQHVRHYVSLGIPSKEAIKKVAVEREIPKREVYQAYHTNE